MKSNRSEEKKKYIVLSVKLAKKLAFLACLIFVVMGWTETGLISTHTSIRHIFITYDPMTNHIEVRYVLKWSAMIT